MILRITNSHESHYSFHGLQPGLDSDFQKKHLIHALKQKV